MRKNKQKLKGWTQEDLANGEEGLSAFFVDYLF